MYVCMYVLDGWMDGWILSSPMSPMHACIHHIFLSSLCVCVCVFVMYSLTLFEFL